MCGLCMNYFTIYASSLLVATCDMNWCPGGDSNLLGAFIYFHLVSLDVAYQHLAAERISKEMQIDATKRCESSK